MSSQTKQIMILLVSQPGITHATLLSILQSIPNVIVADTNGALTAYDLIRKQAVDVCLLDANIPIAERIALITNIKQHFPLIKCIALTNTTRNHEQLRTAGADRLLHVDCTLQTVKTAVFSQ